MVVEAAESASVCGPTEPLLRATVWVERRLVVFTRRETEEVVSGPEGANYLSRHSLRDLFCRAVKDRVDYIKGDHAAAHDGTRGDGSPEHVRAGELPNRQQAGDHRHQNAEARRPKGNLGHDAGIEEASFHCPPV